MSVSQRPSSVNGQPLSPISSEDRHPTVFIFASPGDREAVRIAGGVDADLYDLEDLDSPGVDDDIIIAAIGDRDVFIVAPSTNEHAARTRRFRARLLAIDDQSPVATRFYAGERLPLPDGLSRSQREAWLLADLSEHPVEKVAVAVDHERHRVFAEVMRLLPRDRQMFRQAGILVGVAAIDQDVEKLQGGVVLRNAAGSPRVTPIGKATLSHRLTALIDFIVWSKDKHGEPISKPTHPPGWLPEAILEAGDHPGVRPLLGVAEAPFVRTDGSIVRRSGYDSHTGYHVVMDDDVAAILEGPTQDDARAAADTLFDLVKQFPFATEDDRAVWLAGLLTMFQRPVIDGPTPGFAVVGNQAGCGKGLLIDLVGVIATGRSVPTSSYPPSDEEAGKLKLALATGGVPVVHLDNLPEGSTYGGGPLDSALTTLTASGRLLGHTKMVDGVPLRCVWMLSGNNVSPGKDAHRRWIPCNLQSPLERPEERDDLEVRDIKAHVQERRRELVRAVLTILRAHAVAGRPKGQWAPLGSFEAWDAMIRGAVWFATGRDCNTTRRNAADESPERLDRLALLEAWRELPEGGADGRGITAADALALAAQGEGGTTLYPKLTEALKRFGTKGGLPTVRVLGCTIRGLKGRNIGGMAFQQYGDYQRSVLWKIVSSAPSSPY